MKTIILVEEGRTQLVLQPENDHDKEVAKVLEKLPNTHRSHFYQCQGGYTTSYPRDKEDVIIVFDEEKPKENEQ